MPNGQTFTEAEAYALRDKIREASPLIFSDVEVYQRNGVWYVEDKDTYRSYCSQAEYDDVSQQD